jgi:hypothetical protein
LRNGAPALLEQAAEAEVKEECTDEVCLLAARPRRE